MRIALIFVCLLFGQAALADDSEQVCMAGGYYSGASDRFLSGVAMHILQKRSQLGTAKCSALWQAAFTAGEHFSKTGQLAAATDREFLDAANAFSSRVYSSVSKSAGY